MAKNAHKTEEEQLRFLDAAIDRLRALGGHFPLSDETTEVIWRTTSPVSTSARFRARLAELLGDTPSALTPSAGSSVATTLRRLREASRLTVAQLARKLQVAEEVVGGLERGDHPATRPPEFWEKLVPALSVDPSMVIELLRASYGLPLSRRGMIAARTDDLDPQRRRAWLDVSDAELDAQMRQRLDETIRRLERIPPDPPQRNVDNR